MKILIFARELIPYCNSVGSSLRVVTMAHYLVKNGFDVRILAAKGYEVSYFGLEREARELNSEYLDDALQYFYTKKANALRKSHGNSKSSSKIAEIKLQIKNLIKSCSPIDIAIFQLNKFIKRAFSIIREEKIDVLIVSSPPHSSQLLGLFIKYIFRNRIFLIVDYRDGWNTFSLFRPKSFLKLLIEKNIEKKVLKNADLFIYQSPIVLDQIKNEIFPKVDTISNKALMVRNGYTNIHSENFKIQNNFSYDVENEFFTLGYFGGLDFKDRGFRNPIQLLRNLEKAGHRLNLIIYGNVSGLDYLDSFKNIDIQYKGNVSLDHAKAAMRLCDALLVFHAELIGGEEVIPGKFYEYIDALKPILVYGPKKLECGRMVSEYDIGSFITIEESEADACKIFNEFLRKENRDRYLSNLVCFHGEFSREKQYDKLVNRIMSDVVNK